MSRRLVSFVAAGAVAGSGAGFGLSRLENDWQPHAVGQPVTAFGQQLPVLTATSPPELVCIDVPGKFWGTTWHYTPKILFPTRIETACISYPDGGGTRARVTVRAVAP